jgi:Pectic acid lyase.
VTGGWPKNIDMARYLTAAELEQVLASKERRNDSTIDNNATTTQLKYLARLYKAHPTDVWRDAFARGME